MEEGGGTRQEGGGRRAEGGGERRLEGRETIGRFHSLRHSRFCAVTLTLFHWWLCTLHFFIGWIYPYFIKMGLASFDMGSVALPLTLTLNLALILTLTLTLTLTP